MSTIERELFLKLGNLPPLDSRHPKAPKILRRLLRKTQVNMCRLKHIVEMNNAEYNEERWAQRVFNYHKRDSSTSFEDIPDDSFIDPRDTSLRSFSGLRSLQSGQTKILVKPEHICKTSWTEKEDLLLWNLFKLNKSWDEIAIALDLPTDTVYNRFIEKYGKTDLL